MLKKNKKLFVSKEFVFNASIPKPITEVFKITARV